MGGALKKNLQISDLQRLASLFLCNEITVFLLNWTTRPRFLRAIVKDAHLLVHLNINQRASVNMSELAHFQTKLSWKELLQNVKFLRKTKVRRSAQ